MDVNLSLARVEHLLMRHKFLLGRGDKKRVRPIREKGGEPSQLLMIFMFT